MLLGTIGGIIVGFSMPFFNLVFGELLDALNKNPDNFASSIAYLCVIFVIISAINLFAGFAQVYFWSASGERQAQRFREKYVKAILSQEIGWFDDCGSAELAVRVTELSGKIQDGLGRKVGDLFQYIAQVVGSIAIAFYLNWKLSLVLLTTLPLIAGCGAFMINAITSATSQSLEQYAAAGGLATEALNSIRTVTALNIQPDVITRYRFYLIDAMNVSFFFFFLIISKVCFFF
jgi:ATP-binding cassette subfamily B (MDR/TAP) protein 1